MLSWNWCVWTSNRDELKLALLERLDWTIAALQEIGPESVERLRQRLPDATVVSGLELARSEHQPESESARYGCALVVRGDAVVLRSGLVPIDDAALGSWRDDSSPMPESMVWALVLLTDGVELVAVSAHPPHSAAQGDDHLRRVERKVRTFGVLERFLRANDRAVVGLDGNSWIDGGCTDLYGAPVVEPGPQQAVGKFFHDGPNRHGLRDVYRDWLTADPRRMDEVRQRRPNGPLAVTFVRGTSRKVADRFDAIMASPSLEVLEVEHSYDDSVSAGSDHSYVLAQLHAAVE